MVCLICLSTGYLFSRGYPEGMGHLALLRVWHSPQSASESPFSGEPAGEGNKRDSELSQNMRPNREHMERA